MPCRNSACRFLRVLISHWSEKALSSSDLEEILEPYQSKPPWNVYLNCAVKEIISSSDDSAKWIAANMTPVFILNALKESKNGTTIIVTSPTDSTHPSSTDSTLDATVEESFKANGICQVSPNKNHEETNGTISSDDSNNVHLDCEQP
ncbi:unnamed protein product [Allacma fusca]|uniref:Uncharacterized protein n=1 Tax=Allacma fusca TaxID=39272 RepID=A0A8J2JH24_9HEXA|nr:unnamed protein product [Allacma fusca]